MNHLNEFREYKKPKSYKSKVISISKVELRDICIKLNLNPNEIKYIGSGSWGNAYKVSNRVLKITEHKDEAKCIFELIKNNINIPGIVKYYSVNMFKHKKEYLYVILMDYIKPLETFLKEKYNDNKIYLMVDFMLLTLCYEWDTLKSYKKYVELIGAAYYTNHKTVIYFMEKTWELFRNLQPYILKSPDLHIGNIGIKDNKFLFFDYSKLNPTRRFNDANII